MNKLFDSFWRAAVYCVHPRLIFLSLMPVMVMGILSLIMGHFYWDDALKATRSTLEGYELLSDLIHWLEGTGPNNLYSILASVLLLCLVIPVIVMFALISVELFIMPATVKLVSARRFSKVERSKVPIKPAVAVLRLVKSTTTAGAALLGSAPLCLVPPLVLILPSMIWGWLAYRVMPYDALTDHANPDELAQILKEHQGPLLTIGMISGYLGTMFSLLWVSAAIFAGVMPIFVLAAIWSYILVFVFSSLWFIHYCLGTLDQIRAKKKALAAAAPPPPATFTFTPILTLTQTPTPSLTLSLAPTPPAAPPPAAVVAVAPKPAK